MNVSSRLLHYGKSALLTLALLYSLLAGLRTVTDPDTGWQLASGRYIVQHHQIPSTDVLSYTAHGREWIYPPLAEIVLYGLYALGGFAALSWLNSFGCVATVSCAFYAESSVAAIALAILAVPRIAYRTAPRADMFSTVLFAALLALLWRHFRSRRAPLWLVPVIMLIWVNAHPGFIAGLALLALYVTLEVLEFPFSDRSAAAAARLRRAAPWLLAAIPVTILNRWGWKIYAGVFQQEQSLGVHENLIAEWRRTPISLDTVSQALDWRNPNSGFWWLLAAAVVAAIVALKRKQFGVAALLLGCSYLALHNLRFQGLFAVVAIVIAAPYFSGWFDRPAGVKPRVKRERLGPTPEKNRFNPSWATASILLVCTFLVGIRACDLIFERAYIAAGEPALFGTGLSSRYPKHAAEFIMRERLPGNIFHEYNLGGYLSFRLGPQYPDYVDGRALPFEDVMFEQRNIMRQPPDSSDWQQEADQRGINTLIFSLARYWGLGSNHVKQFCGSRAWKPVYLDEEAVVFVRNVPENATLISRLGIDCGTVKFEPPAALEADKSFRGRASYSTFMPIRVRPCTTSPATQKPPRNSTMRCRCFRKNRICTTRAANCTKRAGNFRTQSANICFPHISSPRRPIGTH